MISSILIAQKQTGDFYNSTFIFFMPRSAILNSIHRDSSVIMKIIFLHSSEDEGCTVSSGTRGKRDADLSSEDEFEKEMNSEAMATLQLMLSPTAAAQAAKGHVTRATPITSANKPRTGKSSRALAKARQRRSSTEQQKKTVRFSGDVKTDDIMEEGTSTG